MEPLSTAMVIKALDGLAVRQRVTAENIANANSEGYRALQVRFEDALAAAARSGPEAVAGVEPRIGYAPGREGEAGGMRLDLELARSATTAARYSALIEILNRQLQIQALAVTGGR